MEYKKLLSLAAEIGEKMLCCGAEVSRVEDSISRICTAYGASRVDVFTITSSIVVTAVFEGLPYTQTRRMKSYRTNFAMLNSLNALSRSICTEKPSLEYIEKEISKISSLPGYKNLTQILAWALTAGAFTVFFGGCLTDGLLSLFIGAAIKLCVNAVERAGLNKVFSNITSSFLGSFLAYLFVWAGIGKSTDMIIIGYIMLLIPGIALTNALRDVIDGDIISGVLRFFEACLVAFSIAAGYFITVMIFGGVM